MTKESIKQFFRDHGKMIAAAAGGIVGGIALGNSLYDKGFVDGYSLKEHEVKDTIAAHIASYPWGTVKNVEN